MSFTLKVSFMKILFTGGTSFTGYWFVKELVAAGHQVVCPIKSNFDAYSGVRKVRLNLLKEISEVIPECPYGSPDFFEVIQSSKWDIFCHHAADVTNYKSPDFDPVKALGNNTGALKSILTKLLEQGCQRTVLTGSVFEQGEGAGSDGLRAVSPYGLSKGLTSDFFAYYCAVVGMPLGKFVIPNPFGTYEEVRFTTFCAQNWLSGKAVTVTQPDYVRDNIPVTLLSKAYAQFVSDTKSKLKPCGFTDSQGSFIERFAREMRTRLKMPCEVIIAEQKEFPEPKVRVNTDLLKIEWDENAFWDDLARFYVEHYTLSLT